jgi:hypothetical protein
MQEETKEEIKEVKTPNNGMGGHLPNPPKDCQFSKHVFKNEDHYFIDNIFCCRCKNKCDVKIKNERDWKEYRQNFKLQNPTLYKKTKMNLKA